MVTYYFKNPEEALKRAKAAGKKPGCWYGGITLRSGKKVIIPSRSSLR
jgi:hypothetical protein